jgi:hypothetical protein
MGLSDQVRRILAARGLSLSQVSTRCAQIFGRRSQYYISQRFYYELDVRAYRPSIQQFLALSRITGIRLLDWLRLFGFHVGDISRFQLSVSRKRTVVLDSTVYDTNQRISWFQQSDAEHDLTRITPLGSILKPGPPKRPEDISTLSTHRFMYAKVGQEDAFAFPDIAPGSLVRIDTQAAREAISKIGSTRSNEVFLVDDGMFLNCGRLRRTNDGRIVLCASYFPFSHVELVLDRRFRVLGMVDAEFRLLPGRSPVAHILRTHRTGASRSLAAGPSITVLNRLIRTSRIRAGLSFRQASALSRSLAGALNERASFVASGTLSDYERHSPIPSRIQKIMSLCILYGIGFWDFLQAAGLSLENLGIDAISDDLLLSGRSSTDQTLAPTTVPLRRSEGDFLSNLIKEWQEVPIFLNGTLSAIAGLKRFSLSDVYWVGGDPHPIHPFLVNAVFAAVNRRIKSPVRSTLGTLWEQPLYLILAREGGYLCGCCTLNTGVLTIQPHPVGRSTARQFRLGIDAEVIGQVTAVLRRLTHSGAPSN